MNSIYFKNFMATATVVLASFLIVGIAFVFMGRYFVMTDAKDNMMANADEIARAAEVLSDDELDNWNIRMTLSVLAQGTGNHIFLCEEDGLVVSCSDMDLACEHIGRLISQTYLHTIVAEERMSKLTDLDGFYEGARVVVGEPIRSNEEVTGYVFVTKDASTIVGAYGTFIYVFFLTCLAVLSIAMIISLVFSKTMSKSLDEMAIAARKYAHGDFSMRVTSYSDRADEMGALTDSFNAMADSLEKSERSRQEFIANVSHELKTPMTTIAGFAEGLLDGTIPKQEEEKYLVVIADETRRLSRLVREMLDMSRMQDSMADSRNLSDFNLNEAVITTLLSFESRAEEKQLEVDLQLPEDELWVRANEDAIHRVIYNLMDNAVKFAHPGGVMSIAIWKQGGKAFVSVADQGETIPADDLPFIFDRFHKSDRSRSMDRDGVGLGLYLVKSILDAHDEDIVATSRDGVTKFVFTLKLVEQRKGQNGSGKKSPDMRK